MEQMSTECHCVIKAYCFALIIWSAELQRTSSHSNDGYHTNTAIEAHVFAEPMLEIIIRAFIMQS
eukprot:IDg18322t1